MSVYKIEIETTFKHDVFVEAENLDEAIEISNELTIEDLDTNDSALEDFSIMRVSEVVNED